MEGGVPCADPNVRLLDDVFRPLLDVCDGLFLEWHRQQHACNGGSTRSGGRSSNSSGSGNGSCTNNGTEALRRRGDWTKRKKKCRRLMTFVTRYTPAPGEQALLKHVDGAGRVDGSVVVALPIDRWSAPPGVNSFEGHGGGLTFWDGREEVPEGPVDDEYDDDEGGGVKGGGKARTSTRARFRPREVHYDTRSGDVAFIDRAVWHQADPITKGTRWALVIFYKVETDQEEEDDEHVGE
jgi:hypothetical protein